MRRTAIAIAAAALLTAASAAPASAEWYNDWNDFLDAVFGEGGGSPVGQDCNGCSSGGVPYDGYDGSQDGAGGNGNTNNG